MESRVPKSNALTLFVLSFALCAGMFIAPTAAHAYVDPGTGSMLFQLLVAFAASIVAAAGTAWNVLLRRKRSRTETPSGEPTAESTSRSGDSGTRDEPDRLADES